MLLGSSGQANITLLKARNSEYTPRVTLVRKNAEAVVMDTDRNIRLGEDALTTVSTLCWCMYFRHFFFEALFHTNSPVGQAVLILVNLCHIIEDQMFHAFRCSRQVFYTSHQ